MDSEKNMSRQQLDHSFFPFSLHPPPSSLFVICRRPIPMRLEEENTPFSL